MNNETCFCVIKAGRKLTQADWRALESAVNSEDSRCAVTGVGYPAVTTGYQIWCTGPNHILNGTGNHGQGIMRRVTEAVTRIVDRRKLRR
jgi:hypothetical protein